MTEHEQPDEQSEREETVEDLDVPDEQGEDVQGGSTKWGDIELKRGID